VEAQWGNGQAAWDVGLGLARVEVLIRIRILNLSTSWLRSGKGVRTFFFLPSWPTNAVVDIMARARGVHALVCASEAVVEAQDAKSV